MGLDGDIVRVTAIEISIASESYTENGQPVDRSAIQIPCSTIVAAGKDKTLEFTLGKVDTDSIEVIDRESGDSKRWYRKKPTSPDN